MNRPEIKQLKEAFSQMEEKRTWREERFSNLQGLLNNPKLGLLTDFGINAANDRLHLQRIEMQF